ncbi:MAG: alpha/beta fold hydrolase [Acidobacteriota bacterium]
MRRRSHEHSRIPLAPAAGALALALSLISMSCTVVLKEDQFFFPEKFPVVPDGIRRENVEIVTADGVRLGGWLLTGRDRAPRPVLIYFYGGAQTVLEAALELYSLAKGLDADVLSVDYRGYGFSEGVPSMAALSRDSLRIYDYVARTLPDDRPVFVAGRSMGTIPALSLAARRPIAGLILVSPFTSRQEVVSYWESRMPWYKRAFVRLRPERARQGWKEPVELVADVEAPILVIHGSEDRTFPLAMGRRMLDEAGSARKVWSPVDGGGHEDLSITTGPALAAMRRFLSENGAAPKPRPDGGWAFPAGAGAGGRPAPRVAETGREVAMVLKSLGPVSCARISGTLYAVLGLFFGAVFSVISLAVPGVFSRGPSDVVARLFGVGAVVWLPILYGVVGFIGGLIAAALYNLLARVVGGVRVELE